MHEKTGRVELGVTVDQEGRPCQCVDRSGEPAAEKNSQGDSLGKLAAALTPTKP